MEFSEFSLGMFAGALLCGLGFLVAEALASYRDRRKMRSDQFPPLVPNDFLRLLRGGGYVSS